MDREPWTYAVTSAEMLREDRIDPAAAPGSGKILDPRTLRDARGVRGGEGCDAGVRNRRAGSTARSRGIRPTRRAEIPHRPRRLLPRGAPIPEGKSAADVVGLRVLAYTRPPREGEAPLSKGTGRVTFKQVNRVFVLDHEFGIQLAPGATWTGAAHRAHRCGAGANLLPAGRGVRSARAVKSYSRRTGGNGGHGKVQGFGRETGEQSPPKCSDVFRVLRPLRVPP